MSDNATNESPAYSYRLIIPSTSNGISKSEFVLSCNFDELAARYPQFDAARKQSNQDAPPRQSAFNPSTDFNKALTRCLLRHHFDLQLPSLPEGRLCPPVPNRANYVCWLKELVSSTSRDLERFASSSMDGGARCDDMDMQQTSRKSSQDGQAKLTHQGIDIGTGVSAIYPLLLSTELFAKSDVFREAGKNMTAQVCKNTYSTCQMQNQLSDDSKWKILATDIDPLAVESARTNVKANNLEHRIFVVQVTNIDQSATSARNGPLFAAMSEARENSMFQASESDSNTFTQDLSLYPMFDFVMTNPPFYSTMAEATAPRAGDKRSRTEMTSNESIYKSYDTFDYENDNTKHGNEGGDVGFIIDIMKDSQFFRHNVTWYTSLVAKRSSLDTILRHLQTLDGVWGNRGQIRTVEFRQGSSSHLCQDHDGHDDPMRCSPRVRWGIAWTYERAVARCDECRIKGGMTSFRVQLSEGDILSHQQERNEEVANKPANVYCNEVVSRLTTYFESFRETPLKCDSESKHGLTRVTVIEARFSEVNSKATSKHKDDNDNLPYNGHFIIDAFVREINSRSSSETKNNLNRTEVEVTLELYCHTKRGNMLVDKIRSALPGEIARTNRKWRRLIKKQKAEV